MNFQSIWLAGGVFSKEARRALGVTIAYLTLRQYTTGCSTHMDTLPWFFLFGQMIYYPLLMLTVIFRHTRGKLQYWNIAAYYHSTFIFFATSLAIYLLSTLPREDADLGCNEYESLYVIAAWTLLVYGVIRLLGDVCEICINAIHKWNGQRNPNHGIHLALGIDSLATSTASITMIVLLYIFQTGNCNESCMNIVEYFYYCITVLIVLSAIGPILYSRLVAASNSPTALRSCLVITVSCFGCLLIVTFTVVYVVLIFHFLSDQNDCKEKAPYVDFFMRYVIYQGIATILFSLVMYVLYLSAPNLDDIDGEGMEDGEFDNEVGTERRPLNSQREITRYT
eukprot:TRINITY_DN3607_c0_g1_i2.p1 TRINITY_DN3607_c0_g1~~TRINITY_DN3607_c0_g1_i2.p1  ORF type:complete len:338 (-),score=35.30 TRINITY_DN3607_c0_g1_i2:184-1197(-)